MMGGALIFPHSCVYYITKNLMAKIQGDIPGSIPLCIKPCCTLFNVYSFPLLQGDPPIKLPVKYTQLAHDKVHVCHNLLSNPVCGVV